MFGAFAGGCAGLGHHGVESRHVRPTMPPKSRSLSTGISLNRLGISDRWVDHLPAPSHWIRQVPLECLSRLSYRKREDAQLLVTMLTGPLLPQTPADSPAGIGARELLPASKGRIAHLTTRRAYYSPMLCRSNGSHGTPARSGGLSTSRPRLSAMVFIRPWIFLSDLIHRLPEFSLETREGTSLVENAPRGTWLDQSNARRAGDRPEGLLDRSTKRSSSRSRSPGR